MKEIEVRYCKKVILKLMNNPLSEIFKEDVKKQLNEKGYEEYCKKVPNPICLQDVLDRLDSKSYTTVDEWRSDVGRIWDNCIKYNQKTSIYSFYAQELDQLFKSQSQNIPSNEYEAWIHDQQKVIDKICKILMLRNDSALEKVLGSKKDLKKKKKAT